MNQLKHIKVPFWSVRKFFLLVKVKNYIWHAFGMFYSSKKNGVAAELGLTTILSVLFSFSNTKIPFKKKKFPWQSLSIGRKGNFECSIEDWYEHHKGTSYLTFQFNYSIRLMWPSVGHQLLMWTTLAWCESSLLTHFMD